jgi:hypothetical protein
MPKAKVKNSIKSKINNNSKANLLNKTLPPAKMINP